ncbi:hypothetical protein HPP92_006378 [Vanilla planifolia]|uniref:Uncharacterized protein n=1 Tax=Vanilla planifolia TaxID=51239 RepID=A0A835RC16_VANPL|nr:hypothetical protein HPP92_006378 [Vanilla planifolia]
MEGKKPSFAEETSPPKLDPLKSIPPPSSLADSSQCGKPTEMGTGESGSEGQSSNGDEMEPLDEIPNCSASQSQAEDNINNGPVMLCDVPEPCLMTSSVHYGGRDDFIPEFTSSFQHKKDKDDDSNQSNVAVRGEWWQGSLYY